MALGSFYFIFILKFFIRSDIMRLWRLHLENYVNIYNGMGLRTLDIDFSKCRNKLLIIKGDNGSGKSSLYNCLSPFIDDSSVFMLDKDVKKVISYLLNDKIGRA